MSLIGVPELNQKVLLYLDPKSSLSLLCVDRELSSNRGAEVLWRKKVKRDFDVVEHQPENLSFHRQYATLTKEFDLHSAIYDGRIDQLILLQRKNRIPLDFIITLSLAWEQFHILEWLESKTNIYSFRDDFICDSIKMWSDRTTEYLLGKLHYRTRHATLAAEYQKYDILKLILEKGFHVTSDAANEAFTQKNYSIMDLLAQYRVFPTAEYILLHPTFLDLESAKWLTKNGIIYTCRLYPHIQKNNRALLQFLFSQRIYGDSVDADVALKYKRNWVLKKMARHGIRPSK